MTEHSSSSVVKARYPLIDILRSLAIVAMIFYHATYDLVLFRLIRVDLRSPAWEAVPNTIVALFLFCVGASLAIGHSKRIRWHSYGERLLKVAGGAAAVSIVTRVLFPTQWVYFGTLHVITFSSLVALPFLRHPKASLTLGTVLILGPALSGIEVPWIKLSHSSMDYIPPVPWFGWVLLGIAAYHYRITRIRLPDFKLARRLSENSLKIYLLHQAILFGLVYILAQLIGRLRG
jgi:uncharacterized membrane protein